MANYTDSDNTKCERSILGESSFRVSNGECVVGEVCEGMGEKR